MMITMVPAPTVFLFMTAMTFPPVPVLHSILDHADDSSTFDDNATTVVDDDDEDDGDGETFNRRRRMMPGMHSKMGSGRLYRSRPRVYVPRRRLGRVRGSSRNNVSPY